MVRELASAGIGKQPRARTMGVRCPTRFWRPAVKLLRSASLPLITAIALTACGTQSIERSAREQAAAGDWQSALRTLDEGMRQHPHSTPLRAQWLQLRAQAVVVRLAAAQAARDAGRLDDAQRELEAALLIEPRNERASLLAAELAVERRQLSAMQTAEQRLASKTTGGQSTQALRVVEQALRDNPRHTGLLQLKRRIEHEQRAASGATGGAGGGFGHAAGALLAEQRPISLDFRDAPLRLVLDAVSRHSGINFILERDVRADQRVTVLLRQARVEDALELLTSTHQLSRKVVDPHTVLIYPNTPEKQREHQEQVVRVFHLASADAKAAAAFLRAMLRIREPFVDERSNLLALRETPENIQLAERLVALFDAGEPEVLLEVEVLEVSASRLSDVGIKLPDGFSLTVLPPAGGLTLANAGDVNRSRLALGVGGVLVNLKRDVGDFSTLANPRIRARNREKARVLIGDKIPIVTTTTGVGGFVSESVNYLEVGLKLDVEPTVYADDEVGIRLSLEVSSLGAPVKTAAGSLAYQVGTRNASTVLRLRDGETQLLAGLISRDERSSASGLPGLTDLPVLGRLFSSQQDQSLRTELILAITPRILRNIRRPDASESELWVGTDATPRWRPLQRRAGAGAVLVPAAGSPSEQAAAAQAASQVANQNAAHAAASPTTPAAPPVPSSVSLAWKGPAQLAVGEEAELELLLAESPALRGLPIELAFDATRLRVLSVTEGDVFKRDAQPTQWAAQVDDKAGRIRASVLRHAAMGTATPGSVMKLRLKALAPGAAWVKLEGAQPVVLLPPIPTVAPTQWTVNVR